MIEHPVVTVGLCTVSICVTHPLDAVVGPSTGQPHRAGCAGAATVRIGLEGIAEAVGARRGPADIVDANCAHAVGAAKAAASVQATVAASTAVGVGLVEIAHGVVARRGPAGALALRTARADAGAAVPGELTTRLGRARRTQRAAAIHVGFVAVGHPIFAALWRADLARAHPAAAIGRAGATTVGRATPAAPTAAVHVRLLTVANAISADRRPAATVGADRGLAVCAMAATATLFAGHRAAFTTVHVGLIAIADVVVTGGGHAATVNATERLTMVVPGAGLARLAKRAHPAAVDARLGAVSDPVIARRRQA